MLETSVWGKTERERDGDRERREMNLIEETTEFYSIYLSWSICLVIGVKV